jgi:hypothetical protein
VREKYCWLVADKPNEQGVCTQHADAGMQIKQPRRIVDTSNFYWLRIVISAFSDRPVL